MHGIGNDYIYLNAVKYPAIAERPDLPELARAMSDRHTGIGSDGLIIIAKPDQACGIPPGEGVRMRMFNADGSESEMCGNGVRCVAKFALDRGLIPHAATARSILIQTGAGVLKLDCKRDPHTGFVSTVKVDMGEPILDLEKIPVDVRGLSRVTEPMAGGAHEITIESPGRRRGDPPKILEATFVSMGNPHAVFFHPDVEALALSAIGPMIENHRAFPRRINVHFVQCLSRTELKMRTWERGAGITQACGTGASAVCVAAFLRGRTDRNVLIHLPGGDLNLEWSASTHHVFMTGPAEEVFDGEWRPHPQ